MARHNRDGHGTDQRGFEYTISYQPDWLKHVKVTRMLPTGRQSTKTLFSRPHPPERAPGRTVRTAVRSSDQELFFEIAVTDPGRVVRRITVETGPERGNPDREEAEVHFTIEHRP